jgi:hypothetical protein
MFGGRGNQAGMFTDPQAVEVRDGTAYVLCAGRGNLTVFGLTDYGGKMLLANHMYTMGDFEDGIGPLKDVIRMDAGNTVAWTALGHVYYGRRNYSEAMRHFRLGQYRRGYSMAFGQIRDQWIKDYFSILAALIILGAASLGAGLRLLKRRRRRRARQ